MAREPSEVVVSNSLDSRESALSVGVVVFVIAAFTLVTSTLLIRGLGSEFDPTKLSVIDFTTGSYRLVEKSDPLGGELIRKAYGPYSGFSLENEVALSIKSPVEISIPTFEVGSDYYGLREGLSLRYRFWAMHPPKVVLLGSSMLFMNFRRSEFFRLYPDVHLIDFTLGNNVPPLTEALFAKLDELDLEIEPGTLFLYGMKAWEFDQRRAWGMGAGRQQALDEISKAEGRLQNNVSDALARFLRFDVLRERVNGLVQSISRSIRPNRHPDAGGGGAVVDRRTIAEISNDPVALREYLTSFPQTFPDDGSPAEALDVELVQSVKRVARKIRQAGGRLVIIQLPDSTFSVHRVEGLYKNFNAGIEGLAEDVGAALIDLSHHDELGIDDRHYVWPNNRFDPNHLNAEGSMVFTKRLIKDVISPFLANEPR